MPISFTCPFCGDQLAYPDNLLGQAGTCRTCGQTITISRPATVTPSASQRNAGVGIMAALIVAAVMALAASAGLIFWLLLPIVATHTAANHKVQCENNLNQIALALHNYHDAYGSFPPAYVADAKGKPMHSWRVLILPYLGKKNVYDRYNFAEPWDSPSNSMLIGQMPSEYICPQNPDPAARRAGETNYMVVVGPRTMFPGATSVTKAEVTDGLINTIMLVETTATGVNWMSPTDLNVTDMTGQINASPEEPGSFHPEGGAQVALADGTVMFLPEDTRSRGIYNALTRDGGEPSHLNAVAQ